MEHPVPKSLSNMALLKYYGCLLFFKCLQMYPAKAPFQVLKQSQKSLFIFTFVHRQKNIQAVNLVSTSCQWKMSFYLYVLCTLILPAVSAVMGGRMPYTCSALLSCSIWLKSKKSKVIQQLRQHLALPVSIVSPYLPPPCRNHSPGREG